MTQPSRYAVYLAPPPTSALWRFGCDVLGRDAATGEPVWGFATAGIDAECWRALTAEPRRYGFHATLKAPFRLAAGLSGDELFNAVGALAEARRHSTLDRSASRRSRRRQTAPLWR